MNKKNKVLIFSILSVAIVISGIVFAIKYAGNKRMGNIYNPIAQSPFNSNINAGDYDLVNVDQIGIGTSSPTQTLSVVGTNGIDPFNIASSTGVSMFKIDESGYVGIGKTPDVQLETLDTFRVTDAGGFSRYYDLKVTTNGVSNNVEGTNGIYTFSSGGTEAFRLDATNKRIGISDDTPDFTLEVAGVYSKGYFALSSAKANDGDIFVINQYGKVGIGTTTPLFNLQVAGGTATSTNATGILGVKAGCLPIQDTDLGGWTYCTTLDGTMTCSSDSCL